MIYLGGYPLAVNGALRGFSTMVRVEESDEAQVEPGYYFGPAEVCDGRIILRFEPEIFEASENLGELDDAAQHFAAGFMLPDDYDRATPRNQRRLLTKQLRKLKVDTQTPAVVMRGDGTLQELSVP